MFGSLEFWVLFGNWCLEFGAYGTRYQTFHLYNILTYYLSFPIKADAMVFFCISLVPS
jgi:hypothetical protein